MMMNLQRKKDIKKNIKRYKTDICKINLFNVNTLYRSILCFVTNCLSSITLEVGYMSPLGHSVTKSSRLYSLFNKNHNLKIKILLTDVMTGFITTVMVILANKFNLPYLYIPWLVNTMKNIIICESPALLHLFYAVSPNTEIAGCLFLLTILLLYVEELCIWNNIFTSFRQSWIEYNNKYICKDRISRNTHESKVKLFPEDKNNLVGVTQAKEL